MQNEGFIQKKRMDYSKFEDEHERLIDQKCQREQMFRSNVLALKMKEQFDHQQKASRNQ